MYYYIYDEFVQDKKYERELIAIENRLADLGIAGRVARLALFKDAKELIQDELRRGTISTVVVVGNDETVHKVIDAVSEYDVAFGLVPVGDHNAFAHILGIPHGVAAVDTLSARNIQNIDLGNLNGERFIAGAYFPTFSGTITCDGNYTITPQGVGTMEIMNLPIGHEGEGVNPTDGYLEAVIDVPVKKSIFSMKKRARSVIGSKEFEIDYPEPVVALADGKEIEGKHFSVVVEPMALKVITGRERMF